MRRRKDLEDRVLGVAFGLSVWSWGVLGLLRSSADDRASIVRITIAALHGVVGWLFMRRAPLPRAAPVAFLGAALPSLVFSGAVFGLAPEAHAWPLAAAVLFVVGGLIAMISLVYLGRSFALLPCVRDIVGRGSYRVVRHPAYAGELLMIAACTMAAASRYHIAVAAASLVVFVALLAVRLLAEEKLLFTQPAYREYAKEVRWRLLPGLW